MVHFEQSIMCDGEPSNKPSRMDVVTSGYCDWRDGQIKAARKTLLAPHIVTMYRLWDACWRAVQSNTHTLVRCKGTRVQTDIMKHVFKEHLAVEITDLFIQHM